MGDGTSVKNKLMYAYTKSLPLAGTFDVIVAGSGAAGSTAAIACARQGARTLLIERLPFLGGTSTAVLDTFYGFYTPGADPLKVVGGIADEVVERLKDFGMCLERPNTHGVAGTAITYHPEYLKIVWESLTREAECAILLHAWIQDVVREGDRISGLVVATKGGQALYRSRYVVDASGDADLCYLGGFAFEQAGAGEPAQTLTTTFKMVNVDEEKRKAVPKQELNRLMSLAAERGDYHLPRREGSDHITPVPGMRATIMTRLKSYEKAGNVTINATDPGLWSRAEMEGRLQALEYIRFLKDRVPGYAQAELASFGVQIGVRETRRIYGEYRLNADDVLGARHFEDQIGLCGAPVEDHHDGQDTTWRLLPHRACVGIPYRTLIPRGSANLLVAGRCFSADHVAHSSVRSMGQCMAMGEAAGTAAGMAWKSGLAPTEVNTGALRSLLAKNGAKID